MRLAIVDGTGAWRDVTYAAEMRHSFCKQMADQTPGSAQYERGPSFDGLRMHERGERAASFLKAARRSDPKQALFLAGYSRGASAAIMAAEILQADTIEVDGLFLFDPVARHMSRGGEVIPANVKRIWAARRSLDPGLVRQHEQAGAASAYLPMTNPMRPWFGTTATQYLGSGKLVTAEFRGSHGALGGVGWADIAAIDGPCQQKVADWMNGAFKEVGLPIRLKSYPPSSA